MTIGILGSEARPPLSNLYMKVTWCDMQKRQFQTPNQVFQTCPNKYSESGMTSQQIWQQSSLNNNLQTSTLSHAQDLPPSSTPLLACRDTIPTSPPTHSLSPGTCLPNETRRIPPLADIIILVVSHIILMTKPGPPYIIHHHFHHHHQTCTPDHCESFLLPPPSYLDQMHSLHPPAGSTTISVHHGR